MNFNFEIFSTKWAQILHEFLLFSSNPRSRGVLDLIGCHMHTDAPHIGCQVIEEFLVRDPRVGFTSMAAI